MSAVAYKSPGQRFVIPKKKESSYLSFEEFKLISSEILKDNFIPYKTFSDSVQTFAAPREVLKYPLEKGKTWLEMQTPFYRTRTVTNFSFTEINGKLYNAFTIESDMSSFRIKIIDYISLNEGLLKREIIADSLAVMDSQLNILGYINSNESSVLINKNF
jgi:hypothetical protein